MFDVVQFLSVGFGAIADWLGTVKAGWVSAVADCVIAVGAVATLKVVVNQWKKGKEDDRRKAISVVLRRYFREYRTEAMGLSIKCLKDMWSGLRKKEALLVEYYKRHYKTEVHILKVGAVPLKGSLHFVRRRVSAFYQELAIFADNDPNVREMVYKVWFESDLAIIPEILIPIERKAIPWILGNPENKQPTYVFDTMMRLYEGSLRS